MTVVFSAIDLLGHVCCVSSLCANSAPSSPFFNFICDLFMGNDSLVSVIFWSLTLYSLT